MEQVRVEDHGAICAIGHAYGNAAHGGQVVLDRLGIVVEAREAPLAGRLVRMHEQPAVLGIEIGLVLFGVTLLLNGVARLLVWRAAYGPTGGG